MPRKARVLVPGCPHHIVQRGHNRSAVFITDEDYQYYLHNLFDWKQQLEIKLYAWCLMTNHIHLIVEPTNEPMDLSLLMKRINGKQAAYTNKLEGRSGSLWEGRYKASPIQTETYLLSCLRYVELNPVRAGMVKAPEDYRWSSYRERIQQDESTMLDLDPCYQALALNKKDRIKRYVEFVKQGVSSAEKKMIQEAWQRNQLTGNQKFVDEIEQRMGIRVERRGRGRPKKGEK